MARNFNEEIRKKKEMKVRKFNYFGCVILLLFFCVGMSCNSPKTRTIQGNNLSIKLTIEDISKTKLKFVTRGVGLDKTRGFLISLTIDDRESVVVYQKTNMKSKPNNQYFNNISDSFKAVSSPDKKHVAISYIDTVLKTYVYHLLPKGEPFTITEYNQNLIENIDWNKIPTPQSIVKEFLSKSYYSLDNENLWNALLKNMPNREYNELVISCWPDYFMAGNLIDSLVSYNKYFDSPFFLLLKNKVSIVLQEKTSTTNTIRAIVLGYNLGYDDIRHQAYKNLIDIWPESPVLNTFVRKNFENFPTEIQQNIITKSILFNQRTDTYAYKAKNKEFILDFADSLTIKSL